MMPREQRYGNICYIVDEDGMIEVPINYSIPVKWDLAVREVGERIEIE